ncbi:MAG TPA: hypothetical protein VE975_07605 [Actinomycetota bacterium]|jgi:hypothetical protein|nr:hypothetical protein [Actinomycetota bacterium]
MTERAPGRYALYTHSERRPFTVTVECSSCKQETRVSYLSLVTLMFPVSLHAPFLKEHHSYSGARPAGEGPGPAYTSCVEAGNHFTTADGMPVPASMGGNNPVG